MKQIKNIALLKENANSKKDYLFALLIAGILIFSVKNLNAQIDLPGDVNNRAPENKSIIRFIPKNIPANIYLTWASGSNTESFRVFVSKDPDPSENNTINGVLLEENPGYFSYRISTEIIGPGTYYWKIVGLNSQGTNESVIWVFEIQGEIEPDIITPTLPYPKDKADNQSINPTLSWECNSNSYYVSVWKDGEKDDLVYYERFRQSVQLSNLEYGTTYKWKVDAYIDFYSGYRRGPEWSFTTAEQDPVNPIKTIGYTEKYNNITYDPYRRAMPVTFSEEGQIQSLSIYHQGGTGRMLLGVYSDNAGLPDNLLRTSTISEVNESEGWQTIDLANPVYVQENQTVWLTWVFENNPGLRYVAGTPGRAHSGETWTGLLPENYGSVTISNFQYSVYCTYIPTSSSQSQTFSKYLFESSNSSKIIDFHDFNDGNIINNVNRSEGVRGNGLYLNGNGYINLGNVYSDGFNDGISLNAWIKPSVLTEGYQGIIMHGGPEVDIYGLYIRPETFEVAFKTTGTTNEWTSINDITELWDGNWHMLTAVFDGTKKTVYLDKNEIASWDATGNLRSGIGYNLLMGAGRDIADPTLLYHGYMDETRIFNYALGEKYIKDLYYLANVEPDIVKVGNIDLSEFNQNTNSLNHFAMPLTLKREGMIKSASIYHLGGQGNMILGVYSDKSGEPGILLGTSSIYPVNEIEGWQTIDFIEPVSVFEHQNFWIAFVFEENPVLVYSDGSPGVTQSSMGWDTELPWSFGMSTPINQNVAAYCTYIPTLHLNASEYRFDEEDGNIVLDSKEDQHGLIVNAVERTDGVNGGGIKFNGEGYINLGETYTEIVDKELTLSAWIKPTQTGSYQGIIMHGGPDIDTYGLYINSDNKEVAFKTNGTVNEWTAIDGVDKLWDGEWHLLTATFRGDEKKVIYLDLDTIASWMSWGPDISSGIGYNLLIGAGRDQAVPDLLYNGLLDEVRIFSYAIDHEELTELFNSIDLTPPSNSIVNAGYTNVYNNITYDPYRRAMPITFTENGTIQSLSIYHEGGSGNMILGVYNDNESLPGNLLGTSNITQISESAGWQTLDLANPVYITENQTIWLTWVFENNPGLRYIAGTPGRAHSGQTWTGSLPTVFGSASISNYQYSVYCSYIAEAQPGGTNKDIGYPDVFNNITYDSYRRAMPVTFQEMGNIESLSIYHQGGEGQMILAVYDDNGGLPGNLLGTSEVTDVQAIEGWQTLKLTSGIPVTENQTVWLSWMFETSPGLRYQSGAPGRAHSGQLWSGTMPASFGSASVSNYQYSIYCTYSTDTQSETEMNEGYPEVFDNITYDPYRRAMPATFTENGTIQNLSIYHQGGFGQMILGVYDDFAGQPGSLLGTTDISSVVGNEGWQSIELITPIQVNEGQTVWLSWMFENNPGLRYRTGTPGRAHSGQAWTGSMPLDFGSSTTANYQYSIYCSYTVEPDQKSQTIRFDNENVDRSLIHIYPNPTHGNLSVEWDSESGNEILISIYDITGNMLLQVQGGKDTFNQSINIQHFNSGLYFLTITNQQGTILTKTKLIKM